MFKRYDLIAPYREEDSGGEQPGSTPGNPAPSETSPPAETTDPGNAAPTEDHGADHVPEDNPWEELSRDLEAEDSDDDFLEEPAPHPPPVEPAPPEEPTPAEPPAEEPEPEPEPEPTPEVQPPETPTPEPPEQPSEEKLEEMKQQMLQGLETQFQISEDEALQLVTQPREMFPKLQARMFMGMYEGLMSTLRQHLPAAIEQTIKQSSARAEKVDTFFAAWPKLDKVKHGADVANFAKVYAEVNPDASEEEVIRDVGLQVMFKHGITPDDVQRQIEETPPPPPPRPPAVNGGSPPQPSTNMYEAMAEELLEDDLTY